MKNWQVLAILACLLAAIGIIYCICSEIIEDRKEAEQDRLAQLKKKELSDNFEKTPPFLR